MSALDPKLARLATDAARAAHAVFHQEGWTWTRDGDDHVPSIAEIEACVLESMAAVELGFTASSGRVAVTRYVDDDEECWDVTLDLGYVELPMVRSAA